MREKFFFKERTRARGATTDRTERGWFAVEGSDASIVSCLFVFLFVCA